MEGEGRSSFELARRAVASIGQVPLTFTAVIRLLCSDHREGFATFSKKSEFEVARLLKVSTVAALLYYAAKTYMPNKIEDREFRPIELARQYDPLSLAAIFSLSYLFKRCQKLCPPEDWKRLGSSINKWVEIGGALGREVEGITFGIGLIAGALPLLGNVPIIVHDRKGFQEYRRGQHRYSPIGDTERERKQFGCSALEIGASLLQVMGFGPAIAAAFEHGLSNESLISKSDLTAPFNLFGTWARGLEIEVGQPAILTAPSQTMPPQRLPIFLGRVSDILTQSVESPWLERTRHDLLTEKVLLLSP